MKRFFTLTVFSLLITFCNAQSVDTLSILKTNAENYIFNKIPNPKSYKSLGWSEIFKTNNGLSLINVFTFKNKKDLTVKIGYNFKFSKDLFLISVNTDPIAKQLADMREEIKRNNEEKRRIKDAADIQIKALQNKNSN